MRDGRVLPAVRPPDTITTLGRLSNGATVAGRRGCVRGRWKRRNRSEATNGGEASAVAMANERKGR